ncbi:MAG: hypothetical protein LBQ82_06000 [Treponema sp.]|jgi:hypothetical protein|nr:hypothetical protein [Treponema sp.]
MVAVKGIYQGGDTVKLDSLSVQFAEPYEVVVAFLNPVQNIEKIEAINKKRQEAFERFMQYGGTLSADFDYKIEPANAEEIAMIDERMKDYENDPSSFAPLRH